MSLTYFVMTAFFLGLFSKAQDRELLANLYNTRVEIKKSAFEYSRLQQEILKSKIEIESQGQALQKEEKELSALKKSLADRVGLIYKMHRTKPVDFLYQASASQERLRQMYYLKHLSAQDQNLVKKTALKIRDQKNKKEKIDANLSRFQALQKKAKNKQASLLQAEKTQRDIIRNLQLNSTTKNKTYFSEKRGRLAFPVSGKVVTPFGLSYLDKDKSIAKLYTGVEFQAQPGSSVRSVYAGEVLFAGQVKGWGPTIIVDHGESYYSVYSGFHRLSVRPGDLVKEQQILAEVAAIPYNKNNKVYFEIRHYSEPDDPHDWLKGDL
jgi:murein hydrolase activator